ncbi:hypothetical protein AB0G04_11400 [Actinoplanes sp. NPDC023801]|uniref:hypothetical protein n=1 Tax=Actinoplanes sp. NPDC023801 TaxID=3154595 RepID=UPI0033D2FBE3
MNGIDDRSRSRPAVMASLGAVAGWKEESVAGLAAGVDGHGTVAGPVWLDDAHRAAAECRAYGLLSGQGWQEIGAAPPWVLLMAAIDGEVEPGFLTAKLIQVILPLATLAWPTSNACGVPGPHCSSQ